jgi:histidine triad (HIT) family protein
VPPESASDCVFCRIVEGNLPSKEVNRTDGFIAIEDIAPKADVHVLVIPKRHVVDFRGIAAFSAEETKRMLDFIAETARTAGLEEYRLMNFCGAGAGQTVFHLHWHVLGGRVTGMPA